MAGTAVLGRLSWREATVVDIVDETARAHSLFLHVPGWPGHTAGQHLDVRLTADDGYRAVRSYSIASAPEEERIAIMVERIEDGEVSPYLVDDLHAGDRFEVRGPIGGYFVWSSDVGGPLLLVAAGSGIAPLMAMVRHHRAVGSDVPLRLLYSSRSEDEIIYRDALARTPGIEVVHTLTRAQPEGWTGYARRIDRELVGEVAWPAPEQPLAYICGPTSFVETASRSLLEVGYEGARIRTERFGPTGR